jgi:hypothetical protein
MVASQVCIHVQHAYCSDLAPTPADLAAAAGVPLQGVVVRERHPGRRLHAWEKNCVAIGDAACVFDPLHFVDLHAVQAGLVHLLPLFPVQHDFSVERDEYNQNVRSAFERLRDFQAAHYLLNRYGDSPFWARGRAAAPSAALAHKIDAFRARGESVDYEDEAFTIDEWQSLFIGHGVVPETCVTGRGSHGAGRAPERVRAHSRVHPPERSASSARTPTIYARCRPSAGASAGRVSGLEAPGSRPRPLAGSPRDLRTTTRPAHCAGFSRSFVARLAAAGSLYGSPRRHLQILSYHCSRTS